MSINSVTCCTVSYIAAIMTAKAVGSGSELRTAPFDPRFPNQNQTRHCYQSYLDFHRCTKKHGDKYEVCQYFKRVYKSMCPISWVGKWDEQIAEGTFPGQI